MFLPVNDQTRGKIAANWRTACNEVRSAATATGRDPDEVRIVGVTKYVDAATTAAVLDAGCGDLGESRPQQLVEKTLALADYLPQPRWHLIGSLQRNKVRRTVETAHVIHSIDTVKLLHFVDGIAGELKRSLEVLLEVNISGDESKHGFAPDDLLSHADAFHQVAHVRIVGLMGMAGLDADRDLAQRQFAALRELRDRLAAGSGLPLPELSMGMSDDFSQAIAEGATIVRIGSKLFEGIIHDPAEGANL